MSSLGIQHSAIKHFLAGVKLEEVEGDVNGFDLANLKKIDDTDDDKNKLEENVHLDKPDFDVLCCSHKHPVPVVIGLTQDSVEVLKTLHHTLHSQVRGNILLKGELV